MIWAANDGTSAFADEDDWPSRHDGFAFRSIQTSRKTKTGIAAPFACSLFVGQRQNASSTIIIILKSRGSALHGRSVSDD
jgi:hypothetical protein